MLCQDNGNGYGPNLATDAVSMKLLGLERDLGRMKSGTRLGMKKIENQKAINLSYPGIVINVLDAKEQRIRGGSKDSGEFSVPR